MPKPLNGSSTTRGKSRLAQLFARSAKPRPRDMTAYQPYTLPLFPSGLEGCFNTVYTVPLQKNSSLRIPDMRR